MNELYRRGVEALKREDKLTARKLLIQAVKENPQNVKAWLWLSRAVEEEHQQLTCFRRILAIDPQNEYAQKGLQFIERKRQASATKSQSQSFQTPPTEKPVNVHNSPSNLSEKDAKNILNNAIEKLSEEGWSVVSQTESSVQLSKPKQWSGKGLVLFVLIPFILGCEFPVFFVVALIGFLFVASDYLLSKDELKYFTIEQLTAKDWNDPKSKPKKTIPIEFLALGAIGLLALCGISIIGSQVGGSAIESEPRTVSTQKGTFSVPGNGYIDGRDVDASPPLTIMEVRVWDGVSAGRRAVCKIPHGTAVQILNVKQDPDVDRQWYHFQVQSGSCKGWVTWWFVNTQRFDPVGDRIND